MLIIVEGKEEVEDAIERVQNKLTELNERRDGEIKRTIALTKGCDSSRAKGVFRSSGLEASLRRVSDDIGVLEYLSSILTKADSRGVYKIMLSGEEWNLIY